MAALLAVLNLGPWRETLAFGQINILLMGLMVADLLTRSHALGNGLPGSGFLVGVAAGIKLTPLVFGLYFLVRKDWRGLLNMGAGFAATVVVGWLLRPAESLQFWFEILPIPRASAVRDMWTTSPSRERSCTSGSPRPR